MAGATGEQSEWIRRVLGLDFSANADPLMLADRLQTARATLSKLVKDADPAAGEVGGAFVVASKAVEAKAPDAASLVDELEAVLARAASAARGREAKSETSISIDFRKLMIDWHKAQAQVQENILALGDSFLDLDEVQADPRFDEVETVVDSLINLVPQFGDRLDTDLNALLDSGGHSSALVGNALKTLGEYRTKLESAPKLAALEVFGKQEMGGDFPLHRALAEAMDKMELELGKAA